MVLPYYVECHACRRNLSGFVVKMNSQPTEFNSLSNFQRFIVYIIVYARIGNCFHRLKHSIAFVREGGRLIGATMYM